MIPARPFFLRLLYPWKTRPLSLRLCLLALPFLCALCVTVVQQSLRRLSLSVVQPTNASISAPPASWSNESLSYFDLEKPEEHNAFELTSEAFDAFELTDASRSTDTVHVRMTAILPVSTSNLAALAESITAMHHDYQLAEAILLVSEGDLVAVRRELRTIVDKRLWDDASLSLTLRAREGELVYDVLNTAAQALGNEVLVLHKDLSVPLGLALPDVSLPVGFRGFVRGSCVVPANAQQTVDYLVPPFIMPVSLVHKLRGWAPRSWSALGSSIAMLHGGSFGGVIPTLQDVHSEDTWCSRKSSADTYYSEANALPVASTLLDTDQLFLPIPTNATARIGSFGIIMPSVHDLESFAPVICGLLATGYSVSILVKTSATTLGETGNLNLGPCSISYAIVESLADVSSWVECSVFDVLISGIDAPHLASTEHGRFTLINIPREDLPYCDWMSTLSLQKWQSWHTPHVELSIITDSRPTSLARLFHSLLAARYFGDSISLRINIDQAADGETLALVQRLSAEWTHGSVFVHHRVIAGGLLSAVVESWYPSTNDSYGILLEDDVEVSPFFYAWAKHALLQYRYGQERTNVNNLFGISLYSPRNLELRPAGRVSFDAHAVLEDAGFARDTPYLSQVPCSWGALYFPEHWREFHAYLPSRLRASNTVVVPNTRSNRWARSWKRFFIELAFVRGYAMLYPNYASGEAFSTNHLEHGAHVKPLPPREWERKKALFEVPLVQLPKVEGMGTGLLKMPGGTLPRWEDMPLLDLFGEVVGWDVAMERGSQRRREVWGCEGTGAPFDAKDLICA